MSKISELKIGDSVYVRQTAPMNDEEEYILHEVYSPFRFKIYLFSKYIKNNGRLKTIRNVIVNKKWNI